MPDRDQRWAERTVEVPPGWPGERPERHPNRAGESPTVADGSGLSTPQGQPRPEFHRGVARVGSSGPAPLEQTQEYGGTRGYGEESGRGASWSGGSDSGQRAPLRYRMRQLRRGGEWTWIGGLFAFVCWGIWTVSVRGTDFVVPALAFTLVLLVAVGVFALSRLLGRVVIERGLSRVRRSAWGSHLATGAFLTAAGVAYLGQTPWVVDAWNWLRGLG